MVEFEELRRLRTYLAELSNRHVESLTTYYNSNNSTFFHRLDDRDPEKVSEASTATCVLSLIRAGKWQEGDWSDQAVQAAHSLLLADWSSGGLPKKNPFSTAWVLEAVTELAAIDPSAGTQRDEKSRIRRAEDLLLTALRSSDPGEAGSAHILEYPPSAYLTQLAVRVLKKRGSLPPSESTSITAWAWREIQSQIALHQAKSPTADLYQLAYGVILVSSLGDPERITPSENLIIDLALRLLFDGLAADGSWPRSQPLFHYKKSGSAYCYEYELLVQLLEERTLQERLLDHLPALIRAADVLESKSYRGPAWPSGHHPQFKGPESWSTASVFHFVHLLDRLLAEAIRRLVFRHLNVPYKRPGVPLQETKQFAPGLLDSCVILPGGETFGLKEIIADRLVAPVAREAATVERGGRLSPNTPMSAILFGPPGTSKTRLAHHIADHLRWPILPVDPSHFVRNGMDQIQAEVDRLFTMLAATERVVVLLDEIDEMLRERSASTEILSRLLTTGMLPKLAEINRHRRLVFIVATNHIEDFDIAITRHGRFDMLLQVMPPTVDEKLNRWPGVRDKLNEYGLAGDPVIEAKLAGLTYGEIEIIVEKLEHATDGDRLQQVLTEAHDTCTLNTDVRSAGEGETSNDNTWEKQCKDQRARIRIPVLS